MRLSIDASNIRRGGGLTHLIEVLRRFEVGTRGFTHLDIWAPERALSLLEKVPGINCHRHAWIEQGGLSARRFRLRALDRFLSSETSLLWAPGGTCVSRFRPYVTMVRNFLPFERSERARFRFSKDWFRYLYLQRVQSKSFCKAAGLIHISKKTHQVVNDLLNLSGVRQKVIYHGLSYRFHREPRRQRSFEAFTGDDPSRLVYVSQITHYKHQDKLVVALSRLRDRGIPIRLDLVGPIYPGARKLFEKTILQYDPKQEWVHWHGEVPYEKVREFLFQADLGLALSTCETFGMFFLEMMAAGLPVLCSSRSTLPEINGGACPEVDPEDVDAVAAALERMIRDKDLRQRTAEAAYRRAQEFSWEKCANETFQFLKEVAKRGAASPLEDGR